MLAVHNQKTGVVAGSSLFGVVVSDSGLSYSLAMTCLLESPYTVSSTCGDAENSRVGKPYKVAYYSVPKTLIPTNKLDAKLWHDHANQVLPVTFLGPAFGHIRIPPSLRLLRSLTSDGDASKLTFVGFDWMFQDRDGYGYEDLLPIQQLAIESLNFLEGLRRGD